MLTWVRAISFLLVATATPLRAEEPIEWLRRMQLAQLQQGYEGVVVYVHDGRMDQVRIVSRPGIEMFQRFASLSGDRRELLKSGNLIRSLQPNMAPAAWPAMASSVHPIDTTRLMRIYKLQLLGKDHVAGFSAKMIEAEAQDGDRYGQRLWVDQQSGLLLGAALIGPKRELLEQVMFAQLALDATNESFDAVKSQEKPADVSAVLPGFGLIGRRLDTARGLEQRIFSDGLATVSVYLGKRQGLTPGEFSTRRGAVQLYGRQTDALRIVAVGAVPPDSVKRWVETTTASLRF